MGEQNIRETISRLQALDFEGNSSSENLAAIAGAFMQSPFWTADACEELRDTLIGVLSQLDTDRWSDEYLAEAGLVRLPIDANGETIHVGDKVAYVDCDSERGDVTSIEYGSGCVTVVVDHGRAEMDYKPQELRHHKSTVDDILREFEREWDRYGDNASATIIKYAEKLRELLEVES